MQVQLLNQLLAANGAPTTATDGVPLVKDSRAMQFINPQKDGLYDNIGKAYVVINGVGVAVASLAYARLWGYFRLWDGPTGADGSLWAPLGVGAAADKGKLNGAAAIAETSAGVIKHAEQVDAGFRDLERVYLELGAFTNVTSVDAWLTTRGQVQQ